MSSVQIVTAVGHIFAGVQNTTLLHYHLNIEDRCLLLSFPHVYKSISDLTPFQAFQRASVNFVKKFPHVATKS